MEARERLFSEENKKEKERISVSEKPPTEDHLPSQKMEVVFENLKIFTLNASNEAAMHKLFTLVQSIILHLREREKKHVLFSAGK